MKLAAAYCPACNSVVNFEDRGSFFKCTRCHAEFNAKTGRRQNWSREAGPTLWLLNTVGCVRCGKNHRALKCKPFKKSPDKRTTHWARCPNTGDPILAWIKRRDRTRYDGRRLKI